MNQIKTDLLNYINKENFKKSNDKDITLMNKIIKLSKLWMKDDADRYPNGYFMSCVTQELYSIYYIDVNNENDFYFKIQESSFKEEIELFNKICFITGIKPIDFLKKTNVKNVSRIYLRKSFFNFSKGNILWDKLEKILDLYMINRQDLELKCIYSQDIYIILKKCMDYLFINGSIEEKTYLEQLKCIYLAQGFKPLGSNKIK